MNVNKVLTKGYENKRPHSRGKNKPNRTRSGFIPKGAEIPTGELLGILKPGTNFLPFRTGCADGAQIEEGVTLEKFFKNKIPGKPAKRAIPALPNDYPV